MTEIDLYIFEELITDYLQTHRTCSADVLIVFNSLVTFTGDGVFSTHWVARPPISGLRSEMLPLNLNFSQCQILVMFHACAR